MPASAHKADNARFLAPVEPVAAALPWLNDTARLPVAAAPWIDALRATGAEAFAGTGLPAVTWEDWRHTNVRALGERTFAWMADETQISANDLPPPLLQGAGRVVLVNGRYRAALSELPQGVEAASMADAARRTWTGIEENLARVGDLAAMPFVALNAAYAQDGVVLRVAKNVETAAPVEVLFYTIGAAEGAEHAPAVYPRVLYQLGENAGLTVIERHTGRGAYLANSYIAAAQDAASRLKMYRFMDESRAAFHISYTTLQQQKNAIFEGFSCATGARLAREEYKLLLIDKANSASIGGIYMIDGRQHHDFTVLADHFEPAGTSAQHFKGVIDDQARAVYQGKIHVRRTAQKTDGYQSHHALLLSNAAEASAKPELEIYADDVKCSHGATSGFLDPAALFYLRSRGIPAQAARDLLVQSFLDGALEKISSETVKDVCRAEVERWLSRLSEKHAAQMGEGAA